MRKKNSQEVTIVIQIREDVVLDQGGSSGRGENLSVSQNIWKIRPTRLSDELYIMHERKRS